MGYNWAGLGSALGQGITSAIQPTLDLNGITQKLKYIQKLPDDQKALFWKLQGFGKTDADPLHQALALMLTGGQGLPNNPTNEPAKIKVKELSTGDVGLIPETEFDPKLYLRVP